MTYCSQNRMFLIGPSCSCNFSQMTEPYQGKYMTDTDCGNFLKSVCVRYWLIDDCLSLISAQHTTALIGLFSSQIRSMHANVFNLGDGSQSWFHMNNGDEQNVNAHIYSNWAGKHCVFCDANGLKVGLKLGRRGCHTYFHVIISPNFTFFNGNQWILQARQVCM